MQMSPSMPRAARDVHHLVDGRRRRDPARSSGTPAAPLTSRSHGGEQPRERLGLLQARAGPGVLGRGQVDRRRSRPAAPARARRPRSRRRAASLGVSLFLPEVDAHGAGPPLAARAGARPSRAAPWLLKPMRLMSAWCSGRRNRRGGGLPGWARGVTVPTSTQPKPRREQPDHRLGVLVEAGGQADAGWGSRGRRRGPSASGARRARGGGVAHRAMRRGEVAKPQGRTAPGGAPARGRAETAGGASERLVHALTSLRDEGVLARPGQRLIDLLAA